MLRTRFFPRLPHVLLGLGLAVLSTGWVLNFQSPLQGIHAIRQADTLFTAWSYCQESNDFLHPRVAHRGNGSGIVIGEFPLASYVYALPCLLSGHWSEGAVKCITILIVILNALFWGLFIRNNRPQWWPGWTWFLTLWLFSTSQLMHQYLAIPDNFALLLIALAGVISGRSSAKSNQLFGAFLFTLAFAIRPYFIPLLPLVLPTKRTRSFAFLLCIFIFLFWYKWWALQSEFFYYETGLASPVETFNLIGPILRSCFEFFVRNVTNGIGFILLWLAYQDSANRQEWLIGAVFSFLMVFALRAPHLIHHQYYLGALVVYLILAMNAGAKKITRKSYQALFILGFLFIAFGNTQHEWHAQAQKISTTYQQALQSAGVEPRQKIILYAGENAPPTHYLYWSKNIGWLKHRTDYMADLRCVEGAEWSILETLGHGWDVQKCP